MNYKSNRFSNLLTLYSYFTMSYPLRLESLGGKTKKYWEINVEGSKITLTFGKIGKAGDKKVISKDSAEEALKFAKDREALKRGKGYADVVVEEPKKKKRKVYSDDDDEDSGDDWAEQDDKIDTGGLDIKDIISGGRPRRGAARAAQEKIRAELAANPNLGKELEEDDDGDHHGNAEEDEKLNAGDDEL